MKKLIFTLLVIGVFTMGCMSMDGIKILNSIEQVQEDIYQKIKPSVVYVEVKYIGANQPYGYTGLVIDTEYNILMQVDLQKDKIEKISVWVDKQEYEAKLVQSDEKQLCYIKAELPASAKIQPYPMDKAGEAKPGDWVVAINSSGEALNFQYLRQMGTILGTKEGTLDTYFAGGGLNLYNGTVVVNLKGEIIGMGAGYQVVAFSDMRRVVNKMIAKAKKPVTDKDKKKPWVGITFEPINEDYAAAMKYPEEAVLIKTVISGGPADKAGLITGDLIVAVDEQPLTKKGAELNTQFFKYLDPEVDREVNLKVLREGETKILKCKFDSQPEPKEFKADDIGVTVRNITDIEYNNPQSLITRKDGVLVTSISAGSPAATAESTREYLIYPYDIIIELGGTPISAIDDFIKAVDKIRQGNDELVLAKIWRGNYLVYKVLNLKIGRN